MLTKDAEIRHQLKEEINHKFANTDSIVINELDVCNGTARIDIAVINCALHGYEIKSDKDTLERLPKQMEAYNRFFDYITVVCGQKHLEEISKRIPEYWGISEAIQQSDAVFINSIRKPKQNEEIEAKALLQMLWRNEILFVLKQLDCNKQIFKYPKFNLVQFLINNMKLEDIQSYVRVCLKARPLDWRPDAQRMICDG